MFEEAALSEGAATGSIELVDMQRLSALWWDHGLRFPVVAVNGPMQAAAAWDEELAEVLSAPELRVTNYW